MLKIEKEIEDYLNGEVEVSDGVNFSQAKLVNRIAAFQNQAFKDGKKVDSTGSYKYWFDIITPRIGSEVKNIDFDTKDVMVWSELGVADKLPVILSNLYLKKWLSDNHIGESINDDVECFSSWGNVVWKNTKEGYEQVDLKNFYVLNQTAKTLEESDVIERHLLTQADLRAKADVWNNVEDVIKTCGNLYFSATQKSAEIDSTTKFYEIYERNGEISEEDFNEAKGKTGGDKDRYIMAKLIVAGLKKGDSVKQVLFCEEIKDKPYKEVHRGRYEGRWFRKGVYEVLFDCQNRANEIGNQLARGLEAASKWLLRSSDPLIVQNSLTDMRFGDIIKSKDLAQVETRMQSFDQLIADWNRNIAQANELANSYEVVTGESLPAGTPFALGNLQNTNANKLFDFLREKLSIALEDLFNDWIIPVMFRDMRKKTVIDLTGDEKIVTEYNKLLVNAWYINNLLALPPHTTEQGQIMRDAKLQEVSKNKDATLKIEKDFWEGFKPRAKVKISGESVNLASDIQTLFSFIQLETDPTRRNFLLDKAYAIKGIDIPPQTPPTPPQPTTQGQPTGQPMGQPMGQMPTQGQPQNQPIQNIKPILKTA